MAVPADPLTTESLSWIAGFGQALAPFVNGDYVNVPNADAADWATAYWGAGTERLRKIKTNYGPDNVFCFEQCIRPEDD